MLIIYSNVYGRIGSILEGCFRVRILVMVSDKVR